MRRIESNCVGCEECIGCGMKRVLVLRCDRCGYEAENLYRYEDEELCRECLLEETLITDYEEVD